VRFKLKYYLFFIFAAIIAAAMGIWLNISFGIVPGNRLGFCTDGSPRALSAVSFMLKLFKMPCVVFLSGFTLYALPVCVLNALYSGWILGDFAYGCFISPYSSAINIIGYVIAVSALLLTAFISYSAAINRSVLRSAAPSAGALLKNPEVRRFFGFFAVYAAIFAAVACVIYCYGCYFPR